MKVCYVSAFYPESIRSADEMLASWPLLRCLPPALVDQGHEVVVLAHAGETCRRTIGGAQYRFIDPGPITWRVARQLDRWKPRHGPAYYLLATRLVRQLQLERPDVVHFAGLTLDLQLALVARACDQLGVPLVVHFHGGEPDQGRMRRLQSHNAARVSRVLVTTLQQSVPWISAELFRPEQFVQVVESSSPFTGIDRDAARARTGMVGDPIYLSAGRLDAIKDPFTMLRGFELIASSQPNARLYLHYLTADLLPEITTFLGERPELAERIEMRGKTPLEEMEAIYSSADFLLQASLREWSGLAVIEAMSCGCIPVVSDIPSFRMLTDNGKYGRLFPAGDSACLSHAAQSVLPDDRAWLSREIQKHVDRELSFAAMARKISDVYRDLRPELANTLQDRDRADVFGDGRVQLPP